MALQFVDRVRVNITTAGTGTALTVGAAVSGYVGFGGMTVGNTTHYVIEDGTNWEIGLGTLTSSSVFTRTTTINNSSGTTSPISLSGSAILFTSWFSSVIALFAQLSGAAFSGVLSSTVSLAGIGTANVLSIAGAATGVAPGLTASGTDTNVSIAYTAKGTGSHIFNGSMSVPTINLVGANNNIGMSGSAAGANPTIQSFGSDTNIGLTFYTKGTGSFVFNGPANVTGISYFSSAGTPIADASLPVQVNATGGGEAHFAANKAGAYGMLFGYEGSVGVIRQITTDPIEIIVNSTTVAATFLSTGAVTFAYALTAPSYAAAGSANVLTIAGTATGVAPTITASGTDTNVGMTFSPKGTGQHVFNGPISIVDPSTTSTWDLAVSATANVDGVNVKLIGNGSTTPSKTIRVLSGSFQIVNDAYSTVIFSSDDLGNLTANDLTIASSSSSIGSVWTTAATTVTPTTGTLTSATASTRYKKIGKTVHINVSVLITTNGTAAGGLSVALPFTAAAITTQMLMGRETATSGKAVTGSIAASGTVVLLQFYDNSYPGATGYKIYVTGVYESV